MSVFVLESLNSDFGFWQQLESRPADFWDGPISATNTELSAQRRMKPSVNYWSSHFELQGGFQQLSNQGLKAWGLALAFPENYAGFICDFCRNVFL